MIGWSLFWYTAENGRGLFIFGLFIIAAALFGTSWSLRSTRAFVWTAVVILILVLTANIERIAPPDDRFDLMVSFQYHRIVTVALVPALTALFMISGRAAGTMVVSGCLPMLIFVMVGNPVSPNEADPFRLVMIGMTIGFMLLVGQTHYITRPRGSRVTPLHGGEIAGRLCFVLASLVLTAAIAIPVEPYVTEGMRWLYRQRLLRPSTDSSQGTFYLNLAAPPGGFADRMRPLLSIKSPVPPGYLRQTVYRDLTSGKWAQRSMEKDNINLSVDADKLSYRLDPDAEVTNAMPWHVRVLGRRWRMGSNLPQHTVGLKLPATQAIRLNPDDNIYWQNDVAPNVYELRVKNYPSPTAADLPGATVGPARPSAYTRITGKPDIAETDPRYLVIHNDVKTNVAEWVSLVPELAGAATSFQKINAVALFFHTAVNYDIRGPPLRGRSELAAFMAERKGHCTLFASAATLVLRQSGIPARVVGGFLVSERHPVTGDWVVRERDAHAWCEAWDAEARGWRRVEATPSSGLPVDYPPPGLIRAWLEAGLIGWKGALDYMRNANPLVWLANTGASAYLAIEAFARTTQGLVTMAVIFLAIVILFAWRRQREVSLTQTERLRADLISAMEQLERRVAGAVLRRATGETWTEWIQRTNPGPDVAEHISRYQNLRYQPVIDLPAAQMLIKQLRSTAARSKRRSTAKS